MIIIYHYQIVTKNGLYYAKSEGTIFCPICGGRLKVRDSRRRQIISADGKVRVFSLRRLRCMSCGKLHEELPDLFLPHKHYSREVIENYLSGALCFCPAENSTIYRWRKEDNSRTD